MATTIVHKKGDSVVWRISYKQSDGITPVNLTGYTIDVDANNRNSKAILFNIVSNAPTTNAYITTTDLVTGEFSVVIKDTSAFSIGDYSVDIEYTDPDGFIKSSKAFNVKVVERL